MDSWVVAMMLGVFVFLVSSAIKDGQFDDEKKL